MELVLKTSGQQCLVGSNPTASANFPVIFHNQPRHYLSFSAHCKNCKGVPYRVDTQLLSECNRLQFRFEFCSR